MSTKKAVKSSPEGRGGNGLAVMANKCAARTFDISSGMVYASVRDQIARAQLLVRDLQKVDPNCKRMLVVGAGVAGASAAVYANSIGIETVVLETKSQPFDLQAMVSTRMVGPFMYEWPSTEMQSQDYPEVIPNLGPPQPHTASWSSAAPLSAQALAGQLRTWLDAQMKAFQKPSFYFNVQANETRQYVQDFVSTAGKGEPFVPPTLTLPPKRDARNVIKSGRGTWDFSPDYILLAVGMGQERVHLVDGDELGMRGLPFWHDDDLRSSTVPIQNFQVAVFGAGDGAIQDVLRTVTKHDHPLSLIQALESGPNSIRSQLDAVKPKLASLEQQSRLYATWSAGPVYDLIDQQCELLCEQLATDPTVRLKLQSEVRAGVGAVHHIYREQHLTRAYLLNRFCIHLIHACGEASLTAPGHMQYVRHKQTEIVSAHPTVTPAMPGEGGVIVLNDGQELKVDRMVVRFGPDKEWLGTHQLVRLTKQAQADRVSMAAIPLPYVVSV